MSLEPNHSASSAAGGPPDEEWARWEATFMEAKPVLPEVALERIEAAIRRAMVEPRKEPWYRGRAVLFVVLWLLTFAAALMLDKPVAQWVLAHHPLNRLSWAAWAMKLPGYFPVTVGIAALLFMFHRQKLRAAFPPLLAGPIVGAVYSVMKWVVVRHRPVMGIEPFHFHPFARGILGLIHAEAGLSFPSGHAAMAFATATCLALVLPRWTFVFVAIATVVGVERVLENAHYVSDVVAGAGLGFLAGRIATHLICNWVGSRSNAAAGHGHDSTELVEV